MVVIFPLDYLIPVVGQLLNNGANAYFGCTIVQIAARWSNLLAELQRPEILRQERPFDEVPRNILPHDVPVTGG